MAPPEEPEWMTREREESRSFLDYSRAATQTAQRSNTAAPTCHACGRCSGDVVGNYRGKPICYPCASQRGVMERNPDGTMSIPRHDRRPTLLTVDEARALPPTKPLITGVLDLNSVAMLYGWRGSYKSFMALDWSLSIVNGSHWDDRKVSRGPVVYVLGEGVSGFVQRIDAWLAAHPGARTDGLHLATDPVNLLNGERVSYFIDAVEEIQPALIVLDTLSRSFVGGEENGGKDGSVGVDAVDRIRKATGACVLLVHHAGKDATKGGRGWSGWEAAADDVWSIEAAQGDVTLRCTKRKNHPEPLDRKFTATASGPSVVLRPGVPVDRVPESVLNTLRALIEIDPGNGVPAGQWEVSSDVARRSFFRHRVDLLSLGYVHNVGTDKMPRYQATPSGSAIGATTVPRPVGTTGVPSATVPHPFRGGTSGTTPTPDTDTSEPAL